MWNKETSTKFTVFFSNSVPGLVVNWLKLKCDQKQGESKKFLRNLIKYFFLKVEKKLLENLTVQIGAFLIELETIF